MATAVTFEHGLQEAYDIVRSRISPDERTVRLVLEQLEQEHLHFMRLALSDRERRERRSSNE
jgi:hypothetical protein